MRSNRRLLQQKTDSDTRGFAISNIIKLQEGIQPAYLLSAVTGDTNNQPNPKRASILRTLRNKGYT
jgi:hypothetical protein